MAVQREYSSDAFSDTDLVARTIWGEARNQKPEGWAAIAWVIKNRTDHPGWWGRTVREVCLRPSQFSAWNFGDPNRQKMLSLDAGDNLLSRIRLVVQEVFRGALPDPTGGATHYRTLFVNPKWDDEMIKTAEIGAHVFFKEA